MKGDPFGVYVHWPFCAAKCPYCDFNSHVRHKPVDQAVFAKAYDCEIATMAGISGERNVTSVFFGGGTPSLMDVQTVATILDSINTHWGITADAEITLEANPTSVEADRFAGYRTAGVNRVSLGVQSLDDQQLKFLGRLHSADEARRAVFLAHETFSRVSFDMIYARPGQSADAWTKELTVALDLAGEHLSLYQLTIEPGTPFFDLRERGRLTPLDEERAADLYTITAELTASRGFENYEISNYAKPGARSAHNLVYWRSGDYAGVGPGAHGRISTDHGRLATATKTNPEIWWQEAMANGHGMCTKETITREEQTDEMLLMGLRMAEGIDLARYEELSGRPLASKRIAFLQEIGLVEPIGNSRLRATHRGFLVLDAVIADLAG